MRIDIETRKIKHTPYKAVLSNKKVIGIFENNKYIENKNMTGKQRELVAAMLKG